MVAEDEAIFVVDVSFSIGAADFHFIERRAVELTDEGGGLVDEGLEFGLGVVDSIGNASSAKEYALEDILGKYELTEVPGLLANVEDIAGFEVGDEDHQL